MNVDPRGMTVEDWAETMILPLSKLILPPRLVPPMTWKDWANQLIQLPEILALGPPQPDKYQDWREWAFQFNQVVAL